MDGVGIGAETTRCYLYEDIQSGSQRGVERWLKTLVGRSDIVRVWIKPVGTKQVVWHHDGPLEALPDLDALFESSDVSSPADFDIAA